MATTDVLIIGAGPAGLHAGVELRRRFGLTAVILERDSEPGGVPRWCHHHTYPCRVRKRLFTGPEYARAWVDEALRSGVRILTHTTALRLDTSAPAVHTTSPRGPERLEARVLLLATGAREASRHARLISGDRVRGIFTTASLFQWIYLNHELPARRPVVFGSEDVSYSCVQALLKHAAHPAAVVEPARATRSASAIRWYFENVRRVPHFFSVDEFAIHGRSSVESVTFRSGSQPETRIDCDGVIFTGGFTPNSELVRASDLMFNPFTRGPSVSNLFQTTAPAVFAAGNCLRGVVSGDEAALEGRTAARRIAEYLSGSAIVRTECRLTAEPPLAYCCPDRLTPGAGRIAVWPGLHAEEVTLRAVQANRELWSRRFRRVQPGRRLFVPVAELAPGDGSDIRFLLER